jgi:1,4-alpha-glucan branching enzyme
MGRWRARLAVALAAGAAAACAAGLRSTAPVVTPAGVRFVLERPEARSVAVAGSFNAWSDSSHPLAREPRGGSWAATVVLPPGEHQFMFVVDGTEFVSPPLAEAYVDDGFGARNGVVIVRPTDR